MEFVTCGWILIILLGIITISKLIAPEESYQFKISLFVAIVGTIIFSVRFISSIENNFNLWPLIYCGICLFYIYSGGKTVSYKTVSGVFSKITKNPVGKMTSGTGWADPIFEVVTISVDGIPNKSADLQSLKIKIIETPQMQTQTRGVQAKVKNITFMLKLKPDGLRDLLQIEGGTETVREIICEFIDEFFLEQISHIEAEILDQNKSKIIRTLSDELEKEVNHFCRKNDYPYEIVGTVIIGDTELDQKYYEILSRKEYARLEQEAKDLEAVSLRIRIKNLGSHILPSASEKEQIEAAMLSLGIIKKDIQERKYAVDPTLAQLALDIAKYLKK